MSRYRSTLPPLDLLVFFEAACRVGSFTGCAAELHVSQAAVSKRIRQLEDWVGEPLFMRQGKRVRPTDSGSKLFQTVGMSLEFLRRGLASIRDDAQRPLSIAANGGVGMFWLAPHLQSFGLSSHACPTRLITSDNAGDLFSDQNDLAIAYGNGTFPGWNATLLLDEVLTPMAAPALARKLRGGPNKSLIHLLSADAPPLLNYSRAGPDWVDWRIWFASLGLSDFAKWRVRQMTTYSQTIGEAIRGHGIALGSVTLLGADLAAGRLVRLANDVLRTGRGYYLCHKETAVLSREAKSLARFLISAARNEASPERPSRGGGPKKTSG